MQKTAQVRLEEIPLEGNGEKNRKEVEESFYPAVINYLGLCLTCNHSPTCTFTRSLDSPVLYCEEFDISTSVNPQNTNPVEGQLLGQIRSNPKGLLGLCSNCERLNTCALPKAEGGVWHCEEYI